MDHQYIDQNNIAGRYLRKELPTSERDKFQAHMVDCAECSDRVLLAEMFERNGGTLPGVAAPEQAVPAFLSIKQEQLPLRARIVAHLTPWQLAGLFSIVFLMLLATLAVLYWWELQGLANKQ
jgi:hypothetical protein